MVSSSKYAKGRPTMKWSIGKTPNISEHMSGRLKLMSTIRKSERVF